MDQKNDMNDLEVTLFSFGFKYGAPVDATIVWDVRFLPNPYWEESLRHLTGRDESIKRYVLQSRSGEEFLALLVPLLRFLLRENRTADKKTLRLGVGCTGGHHRSVAVVEHLAELLARDGVSLKIEHRDIDNE
ncbi:RNase adapter RapZ [Desulfopila sp. IMCC35008]|uniref:RapZ C-terminal domain-containing protein n=1 Tax=Desulfopila sp. IMCC35008 TaxID=2653858 RepID=UPI0013D42F0F|nr:RNase adapter RapZ [Desulfopila sp. IMCC35008]